MRLSKKSIAFIVFGVILIAFCLWFFAFRNKKTTTATDTTTVTRGSVRNDIEISGTIEAKQSASFGFETGGLLKTAPVKVGDTVQAGQILATLDSQSAALEVAKARADRASGSDSALVALQNARSALQKTEAQNTTTLEQSRSTVRTTKNDVEQAKTIWEQTVRESGDESSLSKAKYAGVVAAENAYTAAQKALKDVEKTVAKAKDAATATLKTQEAAYTAAYQASLTTNGLSSSEALEELARVKLAHTIIRAPWSGVVTEKKVDEGELVTAGSAVISLQTIDNLEIVAFVPETDIIHITAGMPISVELDAYGPTKTWDGVVDRIEPIATKLEGVPTYKTYFRLNTVESQFRQGFSASIIIHAAEHSHVLTVPRRAIHTTNNSTSVYVVGQDNKPVEQTVTVGLTGSDGLIEITSGLTEGQHIFTRLPDGPT